ncbi:MAG: TIGR02680 family protein [Roseburia sp.]|nr:TIGR02680 family protein [Roseburia sp.]
MNERWMMNRIGFVNFWLYDEEEFAFEEGKLLLRGQNGSGKSITTQSFIPFILDGDRTPSRLDPFGSSDRRMEYYFLGEEGKEEATGYLYLEFRKKNTGEYRTIGIGQRARKGKPMDFWGFIILDGRRIGGDIWLYREVGSNKIPLEKGELKKVLGEEAPFTDVPREYKELVNKYLFGFSRAEQYEQFIRLLVKVRAPKLSKEFKPSKVYEILNDSLQTLTDEDLRPMVDAMEKMDGIQGNLDQLKRAMADVTVIRKEYMRYNRYMLGKKGQAYLAAKKEALQAQAQMDKSMLDKESLTQEQGEKQEAEAALRNRDRLAAAELESLLDTDMEEMDAKLDKAHLDKKEEQERKERIEERIQKSRESIRGCDRKIHILQGEREVCRSDLAEETEELKSGQEILRWEGHFGVLELTGTRDVQRADNLMEELQKYRKSVAAGKDCIERHGRDQKQLDEISEEAEGRKRDWEEKRSALARAERETELSREGCIQDFYTTNSQNGEWKLSEELLLQAEKQLQEYQSAADGRKINQILQNVYQQYKEQLSSNMWECEKKLEEQKGVLAQLEAQRTEVQMQEDLEPERREAVAASRKRLEEMGVKAVPFFRTVEFAEGLEPEECAGIESQLADMGLLDALVVAKEDFRRIREDFPEFVGCVIKPQERGNCGFYGLKVNETLEKGIREAVENILSHISEKGQESDACVRMEKERYFEQGILSGRADWKEEAEYVGVLARAQKKERRLRQLSEEMEQIQADLQVLDGEKEHLAYRITTLDTEYSRSFATERIDTALETEGKLRLACEQEERNYRVIETKLDLYRQKEKESYQEMLAACKIFPYGRTTEEYEEVLDAADAYQQNLQRLYKLLIRLEKAETDIRTQEELIEREESNMDDAALDKKDALGKIAELELKIRQYEEYLNRPEVKEKAQRRELLKKEREEIREQISSIGKRLAVIEDQLKHILEEEGKLREDYVQKTARENLCQRYFEEELELRLVLEKDAGNPEACAKEALLRMREGDEGRDVGTMTTGLYQVYAAHNGSLVSYGTAIEECFEEAEAESGALRKRLRIISVWNGKKLYLEEFYQMLNTTIDETALLIQQKDRELFEDILSKTISQQLTDRIAESRKWVQDMSALMKLETSMGLYFSLDWKPRTAENEQELDIKELEKILLRDYSLLNSDDIEKVAAHFRSKIQTQKQIAEEAGESINYMDLVRDALDYRKWFEFQMSYYRNLEGKKNLTNSAFNRFSGGEKAMAMYVPLFAAVNAQYQKAENRDHPRMIALDEAFAGVDDKNISSMFKLVEDMDFDYIMNSQALWGCFDTVPALRISELLRPLNSQVITVIHYTWNGHERILDEQ